MAKEVAQLNQKWSDLHTQVIQLSVNKKTTKQEIDTLKEKLEDYYKKTDAINEERLSKIVFHTIDDISKIRSELNDFTTKGEILKKNIAQTVERRNGLLLDLKDKGYQPNEEDIQTYKEKTESQHKISKQALTISSGTINQNF